MHVERHHLSKNILFDEYRLRVYFYIYFPSMRPIHGKVMNTWLNGRKIKAFRN